MPTDERRSNPRALTLALAAFTVCFFAWSLFGPLGPTLQTQLHLSDFQLAFLIAIPVVLGSVLRIPIGIVTDRFGGRLVFTALMAYSVIPLVLLALFHDSFAVMVILGFLLGVTGASFAVGVPFVNRWYSKDRQGFALGVYGVGIGGTVIAALTAPKMAKHWGLAAPFWVAAGLLTAMTLIFWIAARDAPGLPPASGRVSFTAPLGVFKRSTRAWALTLFYFLTFGGFVAMFLYLPKLLTGVVGAAGGLGGFFPPLVMALVKSLTGSYTLGFLLLAAVAVVCLVVLMSFERTRARPTPSVARTGSGPATT